MMDLTRETILAMCRSKTKFIESCLFSELVEQRKISVHGTPIPTVPETVSRKCHVRG